MSDQDKTVTPTPASDDAAGPHTQQPPSTIPEWRNNEISSHNGNHSDQERGDGSPIEEESNPKYDDTTDELLMNLVPDYFDGIPARQRQDAGSDANGNAVTAASQDDNNIVDWHQDDPENPRNWPTWRKYIRIFSVIALTYTVRLGACMIAPSIPMIMQDFGAGDRLEAAGFAVSVYILGLGLGPLLWTSLSAIYGPLAVTSICNVCFVGSTVGCVFVRSLAALIACRFLAGVFGHCAVATGPGVIVDLLAGARSKTPLMLYHLARVLGFVGGPFAGIWLGTDARWRVLFWIQAGVVLALTLVMVVPPCHGETSARVLLQRRAKRLRRENGNMQLRSRLDAGLTARDIFRRSIQGPFQLLFSSKTCAGTAMLVGLAYGCQCMILTTVCHVAKSWPVFIPMFLTFFAVGCVFGLLPRRWTIGDASEKILWRRVLYGGVAVCLGHVLYGWVLEVGGGSRRVVVGPVYGLLSVGLGSSYIITAVRRDMNLRFNRPDGDNEPSAAAASVIVRGIFGALFPPLALFVYDRLGAGLGSTVLSAAMFVLGAATLLLTNLHKLDHGRPTLEGRVWAAF
ncbi:major facilitator superfamily domain-containing protein [Parachaetomium inaequale]|uniref:Major facilitator superfamily domain-containing protein n=1 Tax=Parachaetomium inaequale TaxID=2588326 RepID=A0AAN6P6Z6_9PEZI|nr:major facilitator superfamily domain-containing protein [Parachaetomium inaequale]